MNELMARGLIWINQNFGGWPNECDVLHCPVFHFHVDAFWPGARENELWMRGIPGYWQFITGPKSRSFAWNKEKRKNIFRRSAPDHHGEMYLFIDYPSMICNFSTFDYKLGTASYPHSAPPSPSIRLSVLPWEEESSSIRMLFSKLIPLSPGGCFPFQFTRTAAGHPFHALPQLDAFYSIDGSRLKPFPFSFSCSR